MIHAVRAEWIKLRSVRANIILIVIAVAVPVVLSALISAFASFGPFANPDEAFGVTVIAPSILACYLSGVLGILGIGQEYRHNTIRVTFAAQPRRSVVLGAKTLVYGVFALAVVFLASALCLVASSAVFAARDLQYRVSAAPLVGLAILCVLMTLFAFGVGCMIRQPAGAIPIFLLWPLLVEGIVSLILDQIDPGLGRWLPFRTGQQLAGFSDSASEGTEHFSRMVSGAYFGAWTLLVVVLGWWVVERRDA